VRTLKATLEQDKPTHDRESQQFDSLSVSQPVAVVVPGAYSNGAGSWAARLNAGGATPTPLGPLTQLGVQKGDTVTVSALGFYPVAQQRSFWFSLGTFLAGLVGQQPNAPVGGDPSRGRQNLPLLQVGVAAGLAPLRVTTKGVPLGYLRLLVFDKDSALVSAQTQQVQLTQLANGGYEPLSLRIKLAQDGYVTAYVGNESDVDVYFDDITVEHRQGLQVQETQYDPAGLELAGLAAPSPGIRGLNNYRFNGKEFQADLGLAWNHQDWRFFDPQLLRWHSVDPEVENGQESWTPYSFGYDNAVRYADSDGRCPCEGLSTLTSFTNGVAAAMADNFSLGGSNRRERMGNASSNPDAFNAGQNFGDRLSIVQGYVETTSAIVEAALLGGGEVGSGGLATPAVALAAPLVVAQGVHGVAMANRAMNNLKDQNGRVNSSAAEELPRMKGSSTAQVEKTMQQNGFNQAKKTYNSNSTYKHLDGSEVRHHPYGNQNTGPYKSGNNSHVHKQNPAGQPLNDRGIVDSNPNNNHIGTRNPADLPQVRNRPHGAGTQ